MNSRIQIYQNRPLKNSLDIAQVLLGCTKNSNMMLKETCKTIFGKMRKAKSEVKVCISWLNNFKMQEEYRSMSCKIQS